MKTIGFVDYFISEWHANNYPKWINEICEKEKLDFKVAYAWAEKDVSPNDNKSTEEWCKEFGVEKCETIEELCKKSDYIMVLAPANPEKHLAYAEEVLKYKKNTYIDKSFAPDYETAKKIFEIGEKYGTKFFSTSALRYSTELEEYKGACETVTVLGNGRSFDEYGIHVIEMTVKCMGVGAKAVRAEKAGDQFNIRIKYNDGRYSNIIFDVNYGIPFAVAPVKKGETSRFYNIASDYFKNLLLDILKFFKSGKVPFDGKETLEVMKLRETILKAIAKDGEWVEL